jgi:hypothetical protein
MKIQDELRSYITADRRVRIRGETRLRRNTNGTVPTRMLATAAAELDRFEWLIQHAENFMHEDGVRAWREWRETV